LYSEFFVIPFGSSLKVRTCPDDLVCPELIFSSTLQIAVIITSSLFIGFKHMSNDSKFEEVNYEFGISSFLR
jgi:hypothetical protein